MEERVRTRVDQTEDAQKTLNGGGGYANQGSRKPTAFFLTEKSHHLILNNAIERGACGQAERSVLRLTRNT